MNNLWRLLKTSFFFDLRIQGEVGRRMRGLPEGPDRRAETRLVMRWVLSVSACVVSCAWDFRRFVQYNLINNNSVKRAPN